VDHITWYVFAVVLAAGSLTALAFGIDKVRNRRDALQSLLDPNLLPYDVRADYVNLGVLRTLARNQGLPTLPDAAANTTNAASTAGFGKFGVNLGHSGGRSRTETVDETTNVDDYLATTLGKMIQHGALGAHVVGSRDIEVADQERALGLLGAQGLSDELATEIREQLVSAQSAARMESYLASIEHAEQFHEDLVIEGEWVVTGSSTEHLLELLPYDAAYDTLAARVVLSAESERSGLTMWGADRLRATSQERPHTIDAAVLGSITSIARDDDGVLRVTVSPIAVYQRIARAEASAARARLTSAGRVSRASAATAIVAILFGTIGTVAAGAIALAGMIDATEGCPSTSVGLLRYKIKDPSFYDAATTDSYSSDDVYRTCTLAFTGFCFGSAYQDDDGNFDDRWLVRPDGRLVAYSPGHSPQVLAMRPLGCPGAVAPVPTLVAQGKLAADGEKAEFQVSRNTAGFVGIVRQLPTGRWQRVATIDGVNSAGTKTEVTLAEPATSDTMFRAVACTAALVPTRAAASFTLNRTDESLYTSNDDNLEAPADAAYQAACAP
jgi:hypothetical protein